MQSRPTGLININIEEKYYCHYNKNKYGIIYLAGFLKTFNRQIDLFRQTVFFSAKNYRQSSHYKN